MALWTVRSWKSLSDGTILAPERYDPRRNTPEGAHTMLRLRDIVQSTRELITPTSKDLRRYLIIDTTNSREGILYNNKPSAFIDSVGSTKKIARVGDVLISRLRPYLRQIAYIDPEIPGLTGDILLACSTEYFVLRSNEDTSIAFLIPFLLCDGIQSVLAAAQEGGHHPRVSEDTLLNLPIPQALLDDRVHSSARVEKAIRVYRQAEQELRAMVDAASSFYPSNREGIGSGESHAAFLPPALSDLVAE